MSDRPYIDVDDAVSFSDAFLAIARRPEVIFHHEALTLVAAVLTMWAARWHPWPFAPLLVLVAGWLARRDRLIRSTRSPS